MWEESGPEDFSGGGGTHSNVYRVRKGKLIRTGDCVSSKREWRGLGQPEIIFCLKRAVLA